MLLSDDKIKALRQRWENQDERLQKIADAVMKGEDWTAHLEGLPGLTDLETLPGDKFPRDLRGANLGQYLQPTLSIEPASPEDAPNIAYIIREAMLNNTPLRGKSPFPVSTLSADDISAAFESGSRFFIAMQLGDVVGAVQIDSSSKLKHNTNNEAYYEISNMGILPACRHQGIGRGIADEVVKFIGQEAKHKWILIKINAELGFEDYYEHLGYVKKEVYQRQPIKGSPAYMEIVMTKKL
jgi:ribosomal protein S18 acetylase RimI-like enzyme